MSRARTLCCLAGAVVFGGCLPSYQRAGTVGCLTAPLLLVAGIVCALILGLLWRFATGERRRFQHGVSALALAALLGLACAVLPIWWGDVFVDRWFDEALWYYGSSYLALLLVSWRVWVALDPDRSFTWAPIASLLTVLLPAIAILPFPDRGLSTSDPFFLLWHCPGTWSFLRKIFVGRAYWGDWPGSGLAVVAAIVCAELVARGCLRRWRARGAGSPADVTG